MRVPVNSTGLHDEGDAGERRDIVEGIAGDSDDVGEIVGLERADFILPAQEFCAIEKTCLKRVERFHSVLHHKDILARLRTVRKRTDVRADSHGNAGSELLSKFLCVKIEHLAKARGGFGAGGLSSEIFGNGESGHSENLFLLHEAHGFVAELIGVIDRDDACLRGVKSARFAGSVDSDVFAGASSFGNGGGKFGFGVLKRSGEAAVANGVGAGLVNFDEVGAFLELLADDGDELVCRVSVGGVGEDALLGIESVGVFVASEDVDGIAADAQAWTGDEAGVDGVAHGGIGRAGTFGAHIALGSKTSEKIIARGQGGDDGTLRDGFLNGLQILGTGMEEEMDMRVDEAGEESDVTEIEDLRGSGMLDALSNFDDSVRLNQNFAGGNDFACLDVEETCGVENDGSGRGGLGESGVGEEKSKGQENANADESCAHGGNDSSSAADAEQM